jgi:hypothetical protein
LDSPESSLKSSALPFIYKGAILFVFLKIEEEFADLPSLLTGEPFDDTPEAFLLGADCFFVLFLFKRPAGLAA